MAVVSGDPHGRGPVILPGLVYIGAQRYKEVDSFRVPMKGGHKYRREAIVVSLVYISAKRLEETDDIRVTLLGGLAVARRELPSLSKGSQR